MDFATPAVEQAAQFGFAGFIAVLLLIAYGLLVREVLKVVKDNTQAMQQFRNLIEQNISATNELRGLIGKLTDRIEEVERSLRNRRGNE